jgi:hypothetical protein
MAAAPVYGYDKAVLVTTRKNGKKMDAKVFQHYDFGFLDVDR